MFPCGISDQFLGYFVTFVCGNFRRTFQQGFGACGSNFGELPLVLDFGQFLFLFFVASKLILIVL